MKSVPSYYAIARRENGVRELPGKADNSRILEYAQLAGIGWYAHDSVPWCAVFVNAMLALGGVKGTNSAAARSFLSWGKEVETPYEGCIVVFKRGNKGWQGHVGFVVKVAGGWVWCLGGNQGDAVNIRRYAINDRNGNRKVLGYREPTGATKLLVASPEIEVTSTARIWLTPGSQGETVQDLQRALAKLRQARKIKPDVGEIDGDWGRKTTRAVLAAKHVLGLSDKPIVGPKTWAALMALVTDLG